MAKKVQLPGQSATTHALSIADASALLADCDWDTLLACEESFQSDTRKGIQRVLAQARKRLEDEDAERARVSKMYDAERNLAASHGGTCWVGLDEVGRGSVAGPLCVGAVVLNADDLILGLNDSKQLSPERREELARQICARARGWAVSYVSPEVIDAQGMIFALKTAFSDAVRQIEEQGLALDCLLLDGNPLGFDPREVSIVKGDARCASIAAASIVAKVNRDALMEELATSYPVYHWESNKGYASAEHIQAIEEYGLSPLHRVSFCSGFSQLSLF